jgi:nucleotide-binding universal stress UspA family protein
MKTILAPIDFSAVSPQVVKEAAKLAASLRARLVLLHVVQPPIVTDSDLGPQTSADYIAAASASAAKNLAALQKTLRAKGLTVTTKHLTGHPGQVTVDQATALHASYIVLGSHGRGAFYELMVGSTASRVLKQARCPVVVVPKRSRK